MLYKTYLSGVSRIIDLPVAPTKINSVLLGGVPTTDYQLNGELLILASAPAAGTLLEISYEEWLPVADGGAATAPLATELVDLWGAPLPEAFMAHPYLPGEPYKVLLADFSAFAGKRLHVKIEGILVEWEPHVPQDLVIRVPAALDELLIENGQLDGSLGLFGARVRVIRDTVDLANTSYIEAVAIEAGVTRYQLIDSTGTWKQTSAASSASANVAQLQSDMNYVINTLNALLYGGIAYAGANLVPAQMQADYTNINFNASVAGSPPADTHPYFELPLTDVMEDVVVDASTYWATSTSVVLGVPSTFKGRLTVNATGAPQSVWVVPAGFVNQPDYKSNPLVDVINTGAVQVPPGGQGEFIMYPNVQYYSSYIVRKAFLASVSKQVPKWTANRNVIARSPAVGTVIAEIAHTGPWVLNMFKSNYSNPDRLIVEHLPPNGASNGSIVNVVLEIKVLGNNANYTAWETKFEARFNANASGGTNPLTVIQEVSAANKLGVGLRRFQGGLLQVKVYSYGAGALDFCTDILTQSAESDLLEAG